MSKFFQVLLLSLFVASTLFAADDECEELVSAPVQGVRTCVSARTLLISVAAVVGVSALILGSGDNTGHVHNDS